MPKKKHLFESSSEDDLDPKKLCQDDEIDDINPKDFSGTPVKRPTAEKDDSVCSLCGEFGKNKELWFSKAVGSKTQECVLCCGAQWGAREGGDARDDDSSVMSKLTERQPYGPRTSIEKIECTNHLLRNYIRKIRDVGGQKRNHLGTVPGEVRDKILSRLMRLRHVVTGAVKHHKINSSYQPIHDTLKQCVTSNIAESYNAKVCKLVEGKRVNLVQRNSYTARSELSSLSTNGNEEVHRRIYKKLASGHSPGIHSKTLAHRRYGRRTRTRKLFFVKRGRRNFVHFALTMIMAVAAVDIEPDEFEHKKDTFLNSLKLDTETRTQLELDSRGQSTCELWKHERRKRLTASNFGKICRMKSTTPCQKTVEQLLYKAFVGNKATRYGMENERNVIDELENLIGPKWKSADSS
ncbi:hypothetical protein J6590_091251 [Homalodisca vitripennis]|nr:hypothetical protein J6590_091251 [Homalodisca vitripennis]